METQEKNNEQLAYLILGSGIILFLAFIIYRSHFNGDWSKSQTEWGAFGDYMNPFIGIISIISFLYFSYTISHLDDNRAKEDRKTQIAITKSQIRSQEVAEIAKSLDSISSIFKSKIKGSEKYHEELISNLELIYSSYVFFKVNKANLFKELFDNENFISDIYDPVKVDIKAAIKQHKNAIDLKNKYAGLRMNNDYISNRIEYLRNDEYEEDEEGILLNARDSVFQKLDREESKELKHIKKEMSTYYSNLNKSKSKFISTLYEFILKDLEYN